MRIVKSFFSVIVLRFWLSQAILKSLHTVLKRPIANTLVYIGIVVRVFGGRNFGLKLILKGRRVDAVAKADLIIRNIVHPGGEIKSEFHKLLGTVSEYPIDRFLILKLPVLFDTKVIEKGAIIFKFSETFIPALLSLNIQLLSKYFRVILEPSSSGYSTEEILAWTALYPERVVVLTPDEGDFQFLSAMDTNLVPVKLGAADWVNPKNFHKIKDSQKKFDAIYVANFNPVKRVDRYIRAVVRISRIKKDYRAALICADHGNSRREVMATLEWASDKANISFFDGVPQADLNKHLNQSKVNMLLSLKEGANKALSEGLFSGTPAILLSENIGVNRASINGQTGKIIPDAKLEDTLLWFSDHYDEFQPEKWANEHISPIVSTETLAKKLKEIEEMDGRDWSVGLFPKVNQPELAYLQPKDDWLLSKGMELLTRFSKGADEKSIISFLEQLQEKVVC